MKCSNWLACRSSGIVELFKLQQEERYSAGLTEHVFVQQRCASCVQLQRRTVALQRYRLFVGKFTVQVRRHPQSDSIAARDLQRSCGEP
jgi:hypothetical protein